MRSTAAIAGLVVSAAAHYIHDPRVLTKKQTFPAGTCGPDNGNQSCPSGQCCSQYGWCGTTSEFCAAPGCQSDFSGSSCDSAEVPDVESTADLPRPNLGSLPYGTIIKDCTTPGKMALTFDDGPYIYTADLLDILAANDAKATFFMNANNGGKGPIYNDPDYVSLLQNMHNSGHQIASHSWSHYDLNSASPQVLDDEIVKNEMAFKIILDYVPTYFRPPYGNCDSACQSALDGYGYHIVLWDLDTLDWEVGAIGGAANFDDAMTPVSPLTDSFICLAHDIHETTVHQLALHMITSARDEGYELVTVGECLGDDKANWYRNTKDGGSWQSSPEPEPTNSQSTSTSSTSASESTSTSEPTSTEPTSTSELTSTEPTSTSESIETSEPTSISESTATSESTTGPDSTSGSESASTSKSTIGSATPTSTDGEDPTVIPPQTGGNGDGDEEDPVVTPAPTAGNGDDEEDNESEEDPEYTPGPTVVTTVCSNWETTLTLTYTSTYCPRPTAPPGAGNFGAPDSEGIYTPGFQSPNVTTTVWDGTVILPTSGNGYQPLPSTGSGTGSDSSSDDNEAPASTFVPVSGAAQVAGSVFLGLAAAIIAF